MLIDRLCPFLLSPYELSKFVGLLHLRSASLIVMLSCMVICSSTAVYQHCEVAIIEIMHKYSLTIDMKSGLSMTSATTCISAGPHLRKLTTQMTGKTRQTRHLVALPYLQGHIPAPVAALSTLWTGSCGSKICLNATLLHTCIRTMSCWTPTGVPMLVPWYVYCLVICSACVAAGILDRAVATACFKCPDMASFLQLCRAHHITLHATICRCPLPVTTF